MEFSPQQQQILLDLARATIRRELGDLRAELPDTSDAVFSTPAGCFVTLHQSRTHCLRGCIGQLIAHEPLRDNVVSMSQAVLGDPRFRGDPVQREELPELEIEITVLSPLDAAKDPTDFDLLNHGIYLRYRGETGCFLPQVARETGWSKEQLLDRLCTEKMGLPADAWKQPQARLSRFTTTIIGPEPFEHPKVAQTP